MFDPLTLLVQDLHSFPLVGRIGQTSLDPGQRLRALQDESSPFRCNVITI